MKTIWKYTLDYGPKIEMPRGAIILHAREQFEKVDRYDHRAN